MRTLTSLLAVTSLSLGLLTVSLPVTHAYAAYPEKHIQLIVPFDAGGGTDIMARIFAPYLAKYLGPNARVVVVNKPGAMGLIGYTEVANAKPDGYTLSTFNMPGGLTLGIQGRARYTLDSITPLGCIVNDSMLLNAAPNSEFKDIQSVLDYARKNPNKLTVGFGGVGAAGHLSLLLLQDLPGMADVKLTTVPFSGGSPARAALMGNHVSLTLQTFSEVASYAKEGQVRVLGIQSAQRSAILPDVPTFTEQNVDMNYGASRGIIAPAGLPDAVREQIEQAILKAVGDPEFADMAAKQQLELFPMTSAEYVAHLRELDKSLRSLWARNPWVK